MQAWSILQTVDVRSEPVWVFSRKKQVKESDRYRTPVLIPQRSPVAGKVEQVCACVSFVLS